MILPLEQQVCSLESARKLKELGCRQESLFYWYDSKSIKELHYAEESYHDCRNCDEHYSAYTVAELGELLPSMHYTQHYPSDFGEHEGGNWGASKSGPFQIIMAETESEARAKMLIYLIENGLVRLEK